MHIKMVTSLCLHVNQKKRRLIELDKSIQDTKDLLGEVPNESYFLIIP